MCVSGISEAPVVLVILVKRLSQARQVDSHMCVSGISEVPVASQASGQSYVC